MSGLESSRAIRYYPWLAQRTSVNAAIIAQQIYYWQCREGGGRIHEGRRWVYNTYQQWADETGLSPQQVKDAIALLENIGALRSEQLDKSNYNRTKFYRLEADHEVFIDPGEPEPTEAETESNGSTDLIGEAHRPDRAAPQTPSLNSYTPTKTSTKKKLTRSKKNAPDADASDARREALRPLYLGIKAKLDAYCKAKGQALLPNAEIGSLTAIDQTIRLDLIPAAELEPMIEWALRDDFWQELILSIPHWRKRGRNGRTKIANCRHSWREATASPLGKRTSVRPEYDWSQHPEAQT